MQVRILAVTEGKEKWLQAAETLYSEKLNHFCQFDLVALRPYKESRAQVSDKVRKESEALRKKLSEKDYVILCDVRGESRDSLGFAKHLEKLETHFSNRRITFVIGGAYGVDETVQKRAQERFTFSKLTMNHHVALLVLLEQIYRAFTIRKGLPYHNE